MIRVLVFDIDDTLIARGTTRIPGSAVSAIRQCHDQGMKIIVATGRGYYLMHQDVRQRVPADFLITVNGACINAADGTVLKSYPLAQTDTEALIELGNRRDYVFGFKFDDSLQAYRHYETFAGWYASPAIPASGITDGTGQDYHLTHGLPLGGFFFSPDNEVYGMADQFPGLKFVECTPGKSCECFSRAVNKGKSIRWVLQRMGCQPEECMAFGDSENDVEMIAMAGIGVAMGNGQPSAKAAADYVTTALEDDGIANALKHYRLI
jgi:Cof subfamily protein (haloacid dehalogenase superfamily)